MKTVLTILLASGIWLGCGRTKPVVEQPDTTQVIDRFCLWLIADLDTARWANMNDYLQSWMRKDYPDITVMGINYPKVTFGDHTHRVPRWARTLIDEKLSLMKSQIEDEVERKRIQRLQENEKAMNEFLKKQK